LKFLNSASGSRGKETSLNPFCLALFAQHEKRGEKMAAKGVPNFSMGGPKLRQIVIKILIFISFNCCQAQVW
jgi:hypothetical protein